MKTKLHLQNLIYTLFIGFIFLGTLNIVAQEFDPFDPPRYTTSIKGDLIMIGNNIVNRDSRFTNPNDPYNGNGNNHDPLDMQYIDIDNNAFGFNTFSSSSASLSFDPSNPSECYNIEYAGLYWFAMYKVDEVVSGPDVPRFSDFNTMKFKVPESSTYVELTADDVFDGHNVVD